MGNLKQEIAEILEKEFKLSNKYDKTGIYLASTEIISLIHTRVIGLKPVERFDGLYERGYEAAINDIVKELGIE